MIFSKKCSWFHLPKYNQIYKPLWVSDVHVNDCVLSISCKLHFFFFFASLVPSCMNLHSPLTRPYKHLFQASTELFLYSYTFYLERIICSFRIMSSYSVTSQINRQIAKQKAMKVLGEIKNMSLNATIYVAYNICCQTILIKETRLVR